MRCHTHFFAGCEGCQYQARLDGRRHRQKQGVPTNPNAQVRSPEEQRRAEELVARLKALPLYDVARYCEMVLSRYHDGIDVRPERRAERQAA